MKLRGLVGARKGRGVLPFSPDEIFQVNGCGERMGVVIGGSCETK